MAKRTKTIVASRSEVAAHFGVAERTVGTWLASGCPGKPGRYNLAAIATWRNANRRREPSSANDRERIWEERFKKEKAKRARLERLRIEGELVDRSESRTCWTMLARRLQQAGSSLQKMFGPMAAKMLNEAIEDCKREVEAVFPDDGRTNNVGDSEK